MIVNGKTYKILQGYQVKESLTYALDSCVVITYLNNKEEFKRFDIAEFLDKKWFISIVNEEYKGNKIMHSLTLAELTLILEKYILSPVSFTNADDTLLYQVRKLLYKVEPLRAGEEPRFKLSNALESFLMGKRGEDFIYNERMTLREILDDMLSFYGFRSYVEDVNSDLSEITIGYLDLNKKSSTIKELPRMTSYRSNASVDSYANEFDILLTNAQSKKGTPKIEITTLRPTDISITDNSNFKIVLDNHIEELLRVKVRFLADVKYTFRSNVTSETVDGTYPNLDFELDITDFFIEKEFYDALTLSEQEEYIPYEVGSKELGTIKTVKILFFPFSAFRQKLRFPAINQAWPVIERIYGSEGIYLTSVDPQLPRVNEMIDDMLFEVKYEPYLNFNFRQSKEQTDITKKITSILNQTERSVDVDRYSATVRSIANLTGAKDLTIETVVKNPNQLYELGDRVPKGLSLVQTSKQVYNEFIKVEYIFIENYRVNTSSRFSRERRLYNIPIENLVNRSLLLKDNLLLATAPVAVNDSLFLNDETLSQIIKSFDFEDETAKYLDNILIQSENEFEYPFPMGSFYALYFPGLVLSKSIIWRTAVQDNYSIGLSSGAKVIGGRNVYLNPYVDDNGEAKLLYIRLIMNRLTTFHFTNQLAIAKSLPLVPSNHIVAFSSEEFTKNSGVKIEVFKDRLETFENITYQLETKASEEIIVGEQFMKMINLLKDHEKEQLWIWVSQTEQYGLGDNECRGVKTVSTPIIVSGASNYIETDYALLASMTSWAVGTLSGKLVFGVNNNKNPNKNKVYFGLSKN